MEDSLTEYAVLMEYYNKYVNEKQEYYNLEQWVSEQESSASIKQMVYGEENLENWDTNDFTMMEAVGVVPYLAQAQTIQLGDIKETSEYIISNTTSAYVYPIICDGEDLELTAIFDDSDRLLNIVSTDTINEHGYVYTWDSVYDFWGVTDCEAELDKVYDITLDCYDEGYTTVAKAYFKDYKTFTSDESHPEKSGYIWKTVDLYIYGGDEQCTEHGISIYETLDDYNNNFVSYDRDSGIFDIIYNHEEYTDCQFQKETLNDYVDVEQFGWTDAMFYKYSISVLVPEGYNDFVYGICNSTFKNSSQANVDNFLYFRFQ